MTWLFASGRVADALLLILALEAVWLRHRGWTWRAIAGLVGAGAGFALALRAALTGGDWPWVALPLALAGALHALDLGHRHSGPRRL